MKLDKKKIDTERYLAPIVLNLRARNRPASGWTQCQHISVSACLEQILHSHFSGRSLCAMPGREEISGADTSASSVSPSRTSAGRSRLPRPSLSPARSLSSTSLSPEPSTCNTLSPPPPHAQNRSRHSPQRTGDVAAPQKAGDSARTFLPRLSPTRLQRPSNFENSGSQKSPKSPRRAETDHVASAASILAAAASAFPLHRFQEFRGVPVFSFGSVRTDHEVSRALVSAGGI